MALVRRAVPAEQPINGGEVLVEGNQTSTMLHAAGSYPHIVHGNGFSLEPEHPLDFRKPFGAVVCDRNEEGPGLFPESL